MKQPAKLLLEGGSEASLTQGKRSMDQALKKLKHTERELLKVLKQSRNPERIEQTLGYIRQLIETLEKDRIRNAE